MLEKSYARYEAALHGLARYGRKLRLEGRPFTEVDRVNQLSVRLQAKYARYRQNGDMGPILQEIARFEADPWQLNVREDGLMPVRLGEMLHELKQGVQGLTLVVSETAPSHVAGPAKGDFLTMDPKFAQATVAL